MDTATETRAEPEEDATLVIPAPAMAGLEGIIPWRRVRDIIQQEARWRSRAEAEQDLTVHQLVGVCVLQDDSGRLLSFRRNRSNRPWLDRTVAIMVGGHVEPQDARGENARDAIRAATIREMAEETNATPKILPECPEAVVIDRESEQRAQHIAVVFKIPVANGKDDATEDAEFDGTARRLTPRDVAQEREQMDPWSRIIATQWLAGTPKRQGA